MSEFKKHDIYKIDKESQDFKKISKVLDQYLQDIDVLVVNVLKEHIFSNGISDEINDKIDAIKEEGRDKVKL